MQAKLEHLPRILWKYGQSIEALRYTVGRESSLPCNKSRVRQCLLMAIRLAHDAKARERLSTGYVQLEAFIADTEFEIIKELQDRLGDEVTVLRGGLSPRALTQIATRAAAAEPAALAILTRVAEQMLARQRELWVNC